MLPRWATTFHTGLLALPAVVTASDDPADEFVVATDPRCPPLACCIPGNTDNCATEKPFSAKGTSAYCCPGGPASDCYRWSEDSPGHDIATRRLSSGVDCRHLCQSHEKCAFWSYLVDIPEVGSLGGMCFLKDANALVGRLKVHPFVVSGERICSFFGEGSRIEERQEEVLATEVGFKDVRWRTSGSTAAVAQSSFGRADLLHAAGKPSWHLEASAVFAALGFVAVLNAVDAEHTQQLRQGAHNAAKRMLQADPWHVGNRGPRRYSFGESSKTLHLIHLDPWLHLLDNIFLHQLLGEIFANSGNDIGYYAAGGGGDFVLGHTDLYQSLHPDIGGGGPLLYEQGPPPAVGVSVVVEDLSCTNGPVRVAPGTHRDEGTPPMLFEETTAHSMVLLCPLPAGSLIVRDLRLWHGGTPNLLNRTRYLPGLEFVSFKWAQRSCGSGKIFDPCRPILHHQAHDRLGSVGWTVSSRLVDRSGEVEQLVSGGRWLNRRFPLFTRHHPEAY
eukprot:TRINITY_DN43360_c0_g1_i1.p1 TRINITY_DN43360_c0_g1~~TRINITY_DN43360_c0_g1_i1.p1  ORF type:complete len:501 (+),score=58.10 TRINITY_DN43360_c0_g1_i1:83-1585(+)